MPRKVVRANVPACLPEAWQVTAAQKVRFYSWNILCVGGRTVFPPRIPTSTCCRGAAETDSAVAAENDDIQASVNTDSRIVETLAAGTYTIEATTYDDGVTGDFTLSVSP